MRRGRDPRAGFALPAVLATVGVVALVFLVAVTALDTLARQTREAVDETRFREQALDLEARAAYLAATAQLTPTTLGADSASFVALDGRPYAATGTGLWLSLQDAAGLINLDALGPAGFQRLFGVLGAPPGARSAMTDRLADYIDPDSLKRADGAEAADYDRAGLAPPPDAPLRKTAQVFGVLGWDAAVSSEAWAALADEVTTDPTSAGLNVNTAPPTALRVLLGLSAAQAEAAVKARAQAPFRSLEDLGRAAGVALRGDAERNYGFPSGRFALKIAQPSAGLVERARLVATPDDPDRPVWIEERTVRSMRPQEKTSYSNDDPRFPQPAA